MVFPGMTRRFRIFEPRYRALVKQCLAEDRPLVILPLSRGGNTVATAARVTGLHNVEEDGRYAGGVGVYHMLGVCSLFRVEGKTRRFLGVWVLLIRLAVLLLLLLLLVFPGEAGRDRERVSQSLRSVNTFPRL